MPRQAILDCGFRDAMANSLSSSLKLTKAKLLKRMDLGSERNDLIEGLLRKKDELNLDIDKLQFNSSLLIIAGSETTATLLSGVTFLLTTNPEALRRLTDEVRSTFKTEEEIDFTSVSTLQYMLACLDEALRMYPPAPLGLPRQTPKGGAKIAGHYVPEDVSLALIRRISRPGKLELANTSLAACRRWCRNTTTLSTTTRSSSRNQKSITRRDGLGIRSSRQTIQTYFSPSK